MVTVRPFGALALASLVLLALALSACAGEGRASGDSTETPPPTGEPTPDALPADGSRIDAATYQTLGAILDGDLDFLAGHVSWLERPCVASPTEALNTGHPRCPDGASAGTVVRVFPVFSCQPTYYMGRDPVHDVLGFLTERRVDVFAVVRLTEDGAADPMPRGRFGIVLRVSGRDGFLVGLDGEGRIASAGSWCGGAPGRLLSVVGVADILLPPTGPDDLPCNPPTTTEGYPVRYAVDDGPKGTGKATFCLAWREAGPATSGFVIRVARPGRSGTSGEGEAWYSVPPGVFSLFPGPRDVPAFSGAPDACVTDGVRYDVYVNGATRIYLGSVDFGSSCETRLLLSGGCKSPSLAVAKRSSVGVNSLVLESGERTLCATWLDPFQDERAYRIELNYPRSGERFSYEVPAGSVSFVVPAPDGRREDVFGSGMGRKDYEIRVIAIRPSGEDVVGSQVVIVG